MKFITLLFLLLVQPTFAQSAPNLSIKNLDNRIKSLSSDVQYKCADGLRNVMCEKTLKASEKSMSILKKINPNSTAMQSKIDNLKKNTNQALNIKPKN